jgi:hypothetical protein
MEISVVRLIDNYSVVINKGSRDGIKNGSRFLIYSELEEIIDPETQENLGKLELPKGYAIIENIQERISVIKSSKVETRTKQFKNPFFRTSLLSGVEEETQSVQLPFDRGVQIGDRVKILS